MEKKLYMAKRIVHKKYVQFLKRIMGTLGMYDSIRLGQMDSHTLQELEE